MKWIEIELKREAEVNFELTWNWTELLTELNLWNWTDPNELNKSWTELNKDWRGIKWTDLNWNRARWTELNEYELKGENELDGTDYKLKWTEKDWTELIKL